MEYFELIEKRRSIREFSDKMLTDKEKKALTDFFAGCKRLVDDIDVEFAICDEESIGKRVEGVCGYRGKAFEAPAYIALSSEKKDRYLENSGFIGANLCLKLTELDIEHCWLTVDDPKAAKKALLLDTDKEVTAVIACGQGKKEFTKKRLDILNPANVKFTKREGHVAPKISQSELVFDKTWGNKMDWDPDSIDPGLDHAFYAASLSPSFLNRQPYRFVYTPKMVLLFVKKDEKTTLADAMLNIGIVMLHFDSVYDDEYGRNLSWKLDTPENLPDVGAPEEYKLVGYYPI